MARSALSRLPLQVQEFLSLFAETGDPIASAIAIGCHKARAKSFVRETMMHADARTAFETQHWFRSQSPDREHARSQIRDPTKSHPLALPLRCFANRGYRGRNCSYGGQFPRTRAEQQRAGARKHGVTARSPLQSTAPRIPSHSKGRYRNREY